MSKPKTMRELFEDFRAVQSKHAALGALDTEPDAIMQYYIAGELGLNDRRFIRPLTSEDWELYLEGRGLERAARELTKALDKLLAGLRALPSLDGIDAEIWRV